MDSQLALLQVLRKLGLDSRTKVTQLDGQSNRVWLVGDHVVRINLKPEVPRLAWEAGVLNSLPEAFPCPRPSCFGREEQFEWVLQPKMPGSSLAATWPNLDRRSRRSLVHQLAAHLRTLHETALPASGRNFPHVGKLVGTAQQVVQQLQQLLIRVASQAMDLPGVDRGVLSSVLELAAAAGVVLGDVPCGLIHGDLHLDNLLVDDGEITAILDFEYARTAPLDLELDMLFRFCSFPRLFVPSELEPFLARAQFTDLPVWLAEEYCELFLIPNSRERLALYRLAYDLPMLLRFPPKPQQVTFSPAHPYSRICATVQELHR